MAAVRSTPPTTADGRARPDNIPTTSTTRTQRADSHDTTPTENTMPLTITPLQDTRSPGDATHPTNDPSHLWQGTIDAMSAMIIVLPDNSTDGRARSDIYNLYLGDGDRPAATLEVDIDTARVVGRTGFGSALPSGHTAIDALTEIVRTHRAIVMDHVE
ncbi:hypothetical protein [Actinomyces wuliandei]|nr:hypothetical protein [Actinomyces wuliandei]